jgi:hypothetical protein
MRLFVEFVEGRHDRCDASAALVGHERRNEKRPDKSDLFSLMLAERTGLEPATPGVTGRYSNQLNYRSVFTDLLFIVDIIGRSGGR